MKSFNLTEWALGHRAIVLFLILAIAIAGTLCVHAARAARGSEVLRAVDDRDGHVARRHRPADPGRGAQPDGEEVRAARPLREGGDLCSPGLRRHDDQRVRRHVARRTSARPGTRRARNSATSSSNCPRASSARSSTTSTATCTGCSMRSRATASDQAELSDMAEDIKRRLLEGADGEEGGRLRQAGQEGLRRVLAASGWRPSASRR